MPRNIETKAKLENPDATRSRLASFRSEGPDDIHRDDVVFRNPDDRLKINRSHLLQDACVDMLDRISLDIWQDADSVSAAPTPA
jgi:hypothetical protein